MPSLFVLDASVTIRWALRDGSARDRDYADQVLDSLVDSHALVPALWYTEVLHVLRCAENDGKFGQSNLAAFAYNLAQLPIEMDSTHPSEIFLAVAAISREFKLSGYDAQYLELAHRRSLPLATLDKDLRKAALKAGVPIYSVS